MFHFAIKLAVLEQEKVLRVWFNDGSVKDIDLVKESARGSAWEPLTDLDYVRAVKTANRGHILEFPDGVTWSVEVCWQEGIPVTNDDLDGDNQTAKPQLAGSPKAGANKPAKSA